VRKLDQAAGDHALRRGREAAVFRGLPAIEIRHSADFDPAENHRLSTKRLRASASAS
jgi:hypothetical protein